MFTDLLFYQATPAVAETYMTRRGAIEFLRQDTSWRSSWTQIVPGSFGGNNLTDLLFYDASAGVGEVYTSDGTGGIRFLRQYTGWRSSWTTIVPGNFAGDGRTDLLFYDASAGVGEFYRQRADGDFVRHRTFEGWRGSWTQIVPGNFGGDGLTDLLFYDASAGVGEFYRTTADGIALLRTHEGWRQSWKQIVPGNFGGDGLTDLLFYDASSGVGEFYAVTDGGGISQIRTHEGWRTTWDQIVPGNFGGDGHTDLLFYDASAGVGEFYAVADGGGISQLRSHEGWRPSWKQIVPGLLAPERCLHIHLRILQQPSRFTIQQMLDGMRQVYVSAGIRVSVSTVRNLNLPGLLTVDIGECKDGFGDNIPGDVGELYRHRHASENDVAIFFVSATVPAANGCAKHPPGQPGAIVTSGASQWTLGHEIGHVFGLGHTDNDRRLMFGDGTDNIVDLPPDLADSEKIRFITSHFVHDH